MPKRALALSLCLLLAAPLFGRADAEALDGAQARAMAAFGETLFFVAREEAGPNLVLSPLSAYVALSLAATGARGDTAAAFEAVLGLNAETAAAACRTLTASLGDGGDGVRLSNSLWMDDDIDVLDAFTGALSSRFSADVFSRDLQDPEAVSAVNRWVKDRTSGLIPSLLDKIDPDAVLLLLSTLYLNATWKEPFNPLYDYDGMFRLADGSEVTAPYMSTDHDARLVFQTADAEGALLPYAGGALGFLAVKPRSGRLSDLSLDGGALRGWLDALRLRESVQIALPRFTVTGELLLNDALTKMGLGDAFSASKADFSGIGRSERGNLFLGKALQKVTMRVHEKGTEASAATVLEMMAMSAYVPAPYELVFDSPFLYAVVEMESGVPLFLGAMDHPGL